MTSRVWPLLTNTHTHIARHLTPQWTSPQTLSARLPPPLSHYVIGAALGIWVICKMWNGRDETSDTYTQLRGLQKNTPHELTLREKVSDNESPLSDGQKGRRVVWTNGERVCHSSPTKCICARNVFRHAGRITFRIQTFCIVYVQNLTSERIDWYHRETSESSESVLVVGSEAVVACFAFLTVSRFALTFAFRQVEGRWKKKRQKRASKHKLWFGERLGGNLCQWHSP